MVDLIDSLIEPRCTGMWGALATRSPSGIEHGAGEVEALLDVDRGRSVFENDPHLLGDVHEQVVEDLQLHGIDISPDRGLGFSGHHPVEHKVASLR